MRPNRVLADVARSMPVPTATSEGSSCNPSRASSRHSSTPWNAPAGIQDQIPGATITRSGPIQVAQDLVTYGWTLAVAEGPALTTGRNVFIVRDGQVTSLYVVIDAP